MNGAVAATAPLQVTVVSSFGVVGGAESWLLQMLDATDRLRVEAVLLGEGPLEAELSRRDIPFTVRVTGRNGTDVAGSAWWLARRLRSRAPEVVLANGVKAASVAVPASVLAGIPVVWAKHDHSRDARLARPLGLLSDRVVAVSEEVAAPTGRRDAVVVPPPRPARSPVQRSRARSFWSSRGVELGAAPTVAMATRLVPYKGVDDAIAALARERARDWQLVVVGEEDRSAPGESERLIRLAEALGVAERVHFTGWVDEAGRWLSAFDAVAVLTKIDSLGFGREGFGLSALEAMLAGRPLVAVDVPSARALDGAGVTVPPGDPDAVAEALGELSSERSRRAAGRAAKRIAAAHPDASRCAHMLAGVLAEAAARPGAGLRGGPPLSVVTTVLNEVESVDDLLGSVAQQLEDGDELVVVDGGSTDGTGERIELWTRRNGSVRAVEASGANISRGRNTGIQSARNDIIACTDAGCSPASGWLQALRAPFSETSPPELVSGVYLATGFTPFEDAMAVAHYPDPDEARRPGLLVSAYGLLLGRTFDPRMPAARSLSFTRDAAERVGGFPEGLDTAEDVAFGRAISASGGKCVLSADAEVRWRQRGSAASTARMYYGYGRGGGLSGDSKMVGRDLVRAAAYLAAPLMWTRGGRAGRRAVLAGAAAYLSLPLVRARRRARPLLVAALVPVALALKDLSKAAGCLAGLAERRGGGGGTR